MILKKIKTACVVVALASSTMMAGCASTQHQESTGQYIDSTTITTKIKSKLLADQSVRSLPITVKTYKGNVQLSGFVDTYYQKQRAAEIASEIDGVTFVRNSLVVKAH
jgi:osmotically-inducible protein OsmY